MIDWLFATMKTLPSGRAKILKYVEVRVISLKRVGIRRLPREQVCRETPREECRRAHRRLLGWEELEAILGVDVVEVGVHVRPAHNQETAVENTDRGRVPPFGQKVERCRVLEQRAAFASRRRTRFENANGLISWMDSRVADEPTGVTAHASLSKHRYCDRNASERKLKPTHHSSVTEQGSAGAERVREDIERRHSVCLEVPECAPSGVVVDLEGVIGCTVEEDSESRRDHNRLERDDPRSRILEVELPPWSCGCRWSSEDEGNKER